MAYQLRITRRANKELRDLPTEIQQRTRHAISDLARDPRPYGHKKLRGRTDYAIRVGRYRVIYDVDDDARAVTILRVGHRRDVYQNL